MALLKIIPYGDPLLRRQSARIQAIDDDIRRLAADMTDTMQAAGGVGLAAPQVGRSVMMFLMDFAHIDENGGGGVSVIINPEIVESFPPRVEMQEGCLSLPQVFADVERPGRIRVRYRTLDWEERTEMLVGLAARVFQHEYDHLVGILFIDRLPPDVRRKIKPDLQLILSGKVIPFDGTVKKLEQTVT